MNCAGKLLLTRKGYILPYSHNVLLFLNQIDWSRKVAKKENETKTNERTKSDFLILLQKF